MANTDRARKLLVRTALVTTSTITTLIGAQSLAMLDVSQTPAEAAAPVTVAHAAPGVAIVQQAPGITILRQSGQADANRPDATGNTTVLPPAPKIAAPQPSFSQPTVPQTFSFQRPIPQSSRSSR
jgi:hypothetical protein